MKEKILPCGVYPTMLTPYTLDNKVDYDVVALMVEWYISQNCDGIFVNCLSSEIDFLTLEERKKILSIVVKTANGRVPIVASGMTVGDIESQIDELRSMAECGADAVILIASRMVKPDESEEILREKTMRIMEALPDCELGFYETYMLENMFIQNSLLNVSVKREMTQRAVCTFIYQIFTEVLPCV